ncbi:MAG: hypothetical protein O7A08_10875 [SAR324 cluster bacterium]|nr:hypothetical protein [SAR324 cluster bacterium]
MQTLTLVLSFLLDNPLTPYLGALPWHLLALLFVLGLLSAGGLHHLIGHTYGLYRAGERASPLLALPGLLVLLVSMQALLACYLLATAGPGLVVFALRAPGARASAAPIGALLLSPAYSQQGSAGSPAGHADKETLRRAILAYSEEKLLEGFRGKLAEAKTELRGQVQQDGADESNGIEQVSAQLLLLALHWAAGDHVNWPPQQPEQQPGQEPPPNQAEIERLPGYILSLVSEVRGDSPMQREDWEHVAGSRFMQRVLEPLMVWQLRYLAAIGTLLVLVTNLGVFYLISRARHQMVARQIRRSVPASIAVIT